MTQDKAPEWAVKMAEDLTIQGDGFCDDGDIQTIALALSQAYERGQGSMRERAAGYHDNLSAQHEAFRYDRKGDEIVHHGRQARLHASYSKAIRSLPIEQDSEVKG